jgi:predicted dehydrogenase
MSNKIKLGIIGFGAIAKDFHLPAFKRLKDVEISCVCRRNMDALKQYITSKDINLYSNYEQMLEKESLDAVLISTPPPSRVEIAKKAASRGVHILC